ncbi:metal-dependent hydrolase [Desulfocapsa sulfexigens DSM 10523]|uniref:Metal-dependent hydrolase n=1 Tax=Desulfocapsa sulfexigens (strain DSM 10523 / SB164P1) TaxID=1167006 RepID=M1P7Q9_DESSD|nr:endonuclease/exonuclease/phosphatase family protein [Desulfocapsa sulfexigens]AGF77737.1 metal-dependent hydrolase [Desulfocapsa sulfexigens DSM 10523]
MRFLLYNIRYATGHGYGYHLPLPFAGFFKKTNVNLGEIVTFIRSVAPDVIALVEVDSGSYRSHKSCQVRSIARALDHFHVVETKYGGGSLANKVPVLNKQGNGLLTNQKIIKHHFHYFKEGVKRLVIEVELEEVVVFTVHLSLKYRHRQQQLEHLHRIIAQCVKPVIVAGDFNTFGGDREVQLFLAATGLENANLTGVPSHPSHAPKRNLDFILHSPEIIASNFSIPDIRLSDHAPLICDFSFPGDH